MSLSINPLAKLVSSVTESVAAASAQAGAAFNSAASSANLAKLDSKLADLSGTSIANGLGSFSNQISQGLSGAQAALGQNLAGAQSAMGGIANQAQSLVSKIGTGVGSISNIGADIAASVSKLSSGNLAAGIIGAATGISKAAGQLNNILSLFRGKNLPANAELFTQRGAVVEMSQIPGSDWRVRIGCNNWALFNSPLFNSTLKDTGGVVWPFLPTITVATKANYSAVDPTHSNYPFQAYKNSQVDDITISGDFSCETEEDAYYWIAATTFFKTVTKMFYGASSYGGNPPAVCQLTGYGASIFNNVPVVVKSFSVDFKDDINYIKCTKSGTPTWVPVLSTITVVVTPIYNRSKLRQFSLQDYASGNVTKTPGYL